MGSTTQTAQRLGTAVVLLAGLISAALPAAAANAQPVRADVQSTPRSSIKASAVLKTLKVTVEHRSGYSRDLFRLWLDADRDGCDTRREVLINEAVARPDIYGSCSFNGGSWRSAYDGVTTLDSSSFDIDHLVPLAEAWDSGAWRWNSATRDAFANDLGYAGSLIAVSASSNRSKSDQDPSEWLPPNTSYWCTYATTWISVKYRWRLSVDRAEKGQLRSLVSSCGNPRISLPAKATVVNGAVSSGGGSGDSGGSGSGGSSGGLDPRFAYCYLAKAAGYGPYYRGTDTEYEWYTDGDSDGIVCE